MRAAVGGAARPGREDLAPDTRIPDSVCERTSDSGHELIGDTIMLRAQYRLRTLGVSIVVVALVLAAVIQFARFQEARLRAERALADAALARASASLSARQAAGKVQATAPPGQAR